MSTSECGMMSVGCRGNGGRKLSTGTNRTGRRFTRSKNGKRSKGRRGGCRGGCASSSSMRIRITIAIAIAVRGGAIVGDFGTGRRVDEAWDWAGSITVPSTDTITSMVMSMSMMMVSMMMILARMVKGLNVFLFGKKWGCGRASEVFHDDD
mmetsp:Transcript_96784/g.144937  ORF Transcript_96784/g.144937 Transcript_96784/m.144937 type:complete len:151 (+) Transcript_96784:94-546(+)